MYHGDRSRKEVLVAYGFRLPSALDNRPLNFEEWEARVRQVVYVSATPGPYELSKSQGVVVEQIIRPTGLMDPPIDVRPVRGQVDDLLAGDPRSAPSASERVLVTTLTKRMAEDLTQYYQELGREGALPALRHRDARAHRDPARPARAASSTCWSASTCCARASTCPRCRWSRSSTPTRKGFLRSSGLADSDRRPRGAQRERHASSCTRTGSPTRCSARISETERRRRSAGAPTTPSTASPPTSIVKAIDDVADRALYRRSATTVACPTPGERRPRFTYAGPSLDRTTWRCCEAADEERSRRTWTSSRRRVAHAETSFATCAWPI